MKAKTIKGNSPPKDQRRRSGNISVGMPGLSSSLPKSNLPFSNLLFGKF
jgi:hypothetical protein